MIQIIIIVFIALAIIGFIMEYWDKILGVIILGVIGTIIIKVIGISGITSLAIGIGIIYLIINGCKKVIKRLHVYKPKCVIKEYIRDMKIETQDSIFRNVGVQNDEYTKIAFNELINECNLQCEVQNGHTYYLKQSLRNRIKENNYSVLKNTIETLGMATYDELMDNSKSRDNWFIGIDLQSLCREHKIIKEINPISQQSKITMYRSLSSLDKNRKFSNLVVRELQVD